MRSTVILSMIRHPVHRVTSDHPDHICWYFHSPRWLHLHHNGDLDITQMTCPHKDDLGCTGIDLEFATSSATQ
jgi:hypothetical protein